MSFHVNFGTHGKDLNDALQAVVSEKDDTNWVIYAYDKGTYDLRVQATGDDGLEGLCDEFSDGKVQFAYAKVIDPNTELPKFVFIGWCGSGVPELRKAFFNSQLSDVSNFVKSYHVQINARDEADVEPSLIMKRVAESSGANYSVHKETKKPMSRAEPVGTNYKKTEIPDIAAMQRESMTKDNAPKPVGTNYAPIKMEPKKLSQRWNVQDEDSASKAQAVRAEREQFEKEVRERETQRLQQQSTRQVDTKQEELQSQQQQDEEEENKQRAEEDRLRREREAQQQQQQEEEERRRRQLEEEEEKQRVRREQMEEQEKLKQQQQEAEEAERRKQQEAEEEKRRQQQQQEEEAERRRQHQAAEEEERRRQQQKVQEEEERRKQEEEEQRRREAEEADRKEKERLQKQQEEEAALQSQLNETADRAVHASQTAGAAAADPAQQQHEGLSAVVLFSYDADESNEMTLVEGELITQIDQLDEGWWFGVSEDGTKQGLFPANYVQLLDEENQSHQAAVDDAAAHQDEEPQHQQQQQQEDQGHVAVALYDYDAEEDNEISFREGDAITHIEFVSEDWWQGVDASGKNIGLFPANYVELKQ